MTILKLLNIGHNFEPQVVMKWTKGKQKIMKYSMKNINSWIFADISH